MPGDMLQGPPPSPSPGISPGGPTPSFAKLAPQGPPYPGQPGQQDPTAGGNQIGGAAVRMALEIDQSLKLLAQAVPTLGPWVEKTVMELRQQVGTALNSGQVPTNPQPSGTPSMPDGSQNLT